MLRFLHIKEKWFDENGASLDMINFLAPLDQVKCARNLMDSKIFGHFDD